MSNINNKHIPEDLDSLTRKDMVELFKIQLEEHQGFIKEIESLREQLAKANERENRLEKILQRYESEQLQPLKQRVKELESAILDSCSTYHFEPDLSQPVSSLNELLIINSKWTLDPEISIDASKFATEKKIEGVNQFCATLSTWEDVHPIGANYVTSLSSHRDSFNEQLRKEQSND